MNTIDEKDKRDTESDRDLFTKSTIRIRITKPDSFLTASLKKIGDLILQVFTSAKDQKELPKPVDNHEKMEPLYLKKNDIITNRRGEHYFYIVESIEDRFVYLRSLYNIVLTSYEIKFKKSKSPIYRKLSTITSDNYLIVSRGEEINPKFAELLKKKK